MEPASATQSPAPEPTRCPRLAPYTPRRPERSPLYRVLEDHFEALTRVHEERFEPRHGPLRAVVAETVGRFLDCGLLAHGFARVRCASCRAEFLVAFSCKGRGLCPSCQARRLAEWSAWLDETLLAAVPHRQVVVTIPKRLRPYFLYDRRRLGRLSQVVSRTVADYLEVAAGARDAVAGVIASVQTFGAVAHWHPHLHLLVSDGVFRRDGVFVAAGAHDGALAGKGNSYSIFDPPPGPARPAATRCSRSVDAPPGPGFRSTETEHPCRSA